MLEEVMLLENPGGWFGQKRRHAKAARKGRRRHNPDFGLDNPWVGSYNPRRHRRKSVRNPAAGVATQVQRWTMGVDLMDVLAGGLGLVLATSIPNQFIKPTGAASLTIGQKWSKVLIAAVSAVAAGFAVSAMGQKRAAKSAIIGGLAGAGVQVLQQFTNWKVAGPGTFAALGPGSFSPRAAVGSGLRAGSAPEFDDVRLH